MAVNGYIYAGAVIVAPSASFLYPVAGATTTNATTNTITWAETGGSVTSRSIREDYGLVVTPGSCAGITWKTGWTLAGRTSPFAISGFTAGYCYRYSLTLTGPGGSTTTGSGDLLVASATTSPTAIQSASPAPTASPTPTATPTATQTPKPSSTYTFDEEFNGTSVSSIWGTHWGPFGSTYAWSRTQDTVANGLLTIKMSKDSSGHWTGGLLDTVGTFTQLYGHFEARIKFDGGYGLWPAFWISQTPQQATHPLEIDAMEVCANPVGANGGNDVTDVHQTVHFIDGTQKFNDYRGAGNTSGAWHTYALDWRAGRLSYYVDGVLGWTYTSANVPSVALPVVLDHAVGGSWCGAPTSATPSTAYMQVDYVRVTP